MAATIGMTHHEDRAMKEFESKVGQKGQITLPAELRQQLGIKPKDMVRIVPDADGLKVRRADPKLLRGYGAVQPHSRPEDWQAIREAVEEGIAEEVMQEG